MRKDEILVVKVDALMNRAELKNVQSMILEQKESGVIVLPSCCTAQIVPKDVEIKVEEGSRWLKSQTGLR